LAAPPAYRRVTRPLARPAPSSGGPASYRPRLWSHCRSAPPDIASRSAATAIDPVCLKSGVTYRIAL